MDVFVSSSVVVQSEFIFLTLDVDAGLVFCEAFSSYIWSISTLSLLVYSVLSSEEFSLSGSAEGTLRSSSSGF